VKVRRFRIASEKARLIGSNGAFYPISKVVLTNNPDEVVRVAKNTIEFNGPFTVFDEDGTKWLSFLHGWERAKAGHE
jgi:hypothetical protein